jgi:hypothetical protein
MLVSDKIENINRDNENKITTLNNTIKITCECMNDRTKALVVQTRRETDRYGQEITAASSSLLASITEHNEQMGVGTDNLNQEINKSKE